MEKAISRLQVTDGAIPTLLLKRLLLSVVLSTTLFSASPKTEAYTEAPLTPNHQFHITSLAFERDKVSLPVLPPPPVVAPVVPKTPSKKVLTRQAATLPPDHIKALIDANFPASARSRAYAIANCESGFNDQAIGDGHLQFMQNGIQYGASYGVFQIRYLKGRPAPSQLLDPEFNVRYAAGLYAAQGFQPWTCSRKV